MRRTKRGGWPYSQPPNTAFELNRDSPQARGLVAWWPMLASPGAQILRDLVNGNDATPTNSPAWNSDKIAGWVTTHDATNYWEAPANSNLDITGPLTVCIWAMLDPARDNGTAYGILGRTNSNWQAANMQWLLRRMTWGAQFKFALSDGNEPETNVASPNFTLGQLHRVVGRYDGTNISCWLDGVSGAPAAAGIQSLASTVTIGSELTAQSPWLGDLADARIYRRALSDAEIYEDYRNPWELYKPIIRRWVGWRAPVGGVTHTFAAILAAASTTPDNAVAAVLRPMAGAGIAASTTPDTVTLAIARAMVAMSAAASTTPDTVVLAVARELAAVLLAQSTTPDTVVLAVARAMAGSVVAASITPDTVVLAISRAVAAILVSASVTPDTVALDVTRAIAAIAAAASVTPDTVVLAIGRAMAATSVAASTTPDTVALAVTRGLAAVLSADSTTTDAALAIARELAAVLTAVSITPDDVVLTVPGIIALAAVLLAQSTTPDTVTLALLLGLLDVVGSVTVASAVATACAKASTVTTSVSVLGDVETSITSRT